MSDQTPTTGFALPTGDQVYDFLMKNINPALLTANLDHLDEPFVSETPEQRTERYQGYSDDFAKYDEVFQKWQQEILELAHQYKRTYLQAEECISRTEEDTQLSSLESSISQS